MGLLAPVSFWFLSLIPVLLVFYFFKKQYDKQPISSIYLWEQTINEWETNRWWNRLQKNLLLLLQLLILLFLIFALTRPFLTGKEVAGDHLVIIIDSSATMAVLENEETRFSIAKKQATELVNGLGQGHRVSVIDARLAPELLISNEEDHAIVKGTIKKLELSYQRQNIRDSIQLAQSIIHQDLGEIHIFTDNFTKQSLDDLKLTKYLAVHNIGTSQNNVSVQTFGVRKNEEVVSAIVSVKNQSEEDAQIDFSISDGSKELKMTETTISANSVQTITIDDLPIRPYYMVELEKDSYLLDNELFAFLPEQQPSSIYQAGEINPFVEKALRSAGIETITIPKDEEGNYHFSESEQDAVYILSGIESEFWPIGPKLVISPTLTGPFEVKEKEELEYRLVGIEDPLLQYTNVNDVYLAKAFEIGNLNGLQPLVKSGEQTIIAKGSYNKAPFLLFSFDVTDSDWPLHPGFPILLTNSIAYLAGNGQTLGYFEPLESVEVKLSPATEEVVIEKINGDNLETVDLQESAFAAPSEPGLYQLHEKTTYGPKLQYFTVQLHEQERTTQTAESFSIDKGSEIGNAETSKQEFWRWFAAMALFILFIEWEVYRRGIASR